MDDETKEIYYAGARARDFGAENAADFPANSRGDVNFKVLAAKIPVIEASGALRESNIGKQATVSKEAAAALLLNYMRKINRTTRGLGVDHPEIAELFRIPHGSSYQKMLAAGTAYYENSEANEELLVDGSLPEDFRAVLLAKINALGTAMTGQNEAKGAEVGATATIAAEIKEIFDAIRRLRGIVPNVYEDNPAKLAQWESASRIQSPPKKKKTEEPK